MTLAGNSHLRVSNNKFAGIADRMISVLPFHLRKRHSSGRVGVIAGLMIQMDRFDIDPATQE
ncbi:hypothetical protein [Rhizobium sp. BK418]|uniref:hypothetical protein n=1 Tax=Rhizobium sp. BK418 TaxID=2512120 RepID=UPI001046E949|nr:hypothetical protein [Rhizobium sp. BK418]